MEEELKRRENERIRLDEEDKDDPSFIDEPFQFYVDKYQDDKIKEIISIFRNDFKPPKNLWIENIPDNNHVDFYNQIFANEDGYVNTTEEDVVEDDKKEFQFNDSPAEIPQKQPDPEPKPSPVVAEKANKPTNILIDEVEKFKNIGDKNPPKPDS